MSDNLTDLARQGRTIDVAGETLTITTVKMRNLPALMAALKEFSGVTVSAETNIVDLLQTHAEPLIRAVAAAVDRPVDWVGDLVAEDMVTLAAAVLEVNADFFFATVLPMLAKAVPTGSSRLNGSSPGATTETSSSSTH